MPDVRGKTIRGRFAHAPQQGVVQIWDDVLVTVGADGILTDRIVPEDPRFSDVLAQAQRRGDLVTLPPSAWMLPGFVDLHVHAPQYPQLGSALELPLEEWLDRYTFPLEARFDDVELARTVYSALVEDLLAAGTTTALMFATIHQDATRILADVSLDRGLRALVGKVAADDAAQCPEYYRDESVAAAVDGTEALINYVRDHPQNSDALVQPVVTPRFVPSCTEPTLTGLAELAAHYGCHIQTHCSESDWAEGYVQQRTGLRDAEYLDAVGLLTPKTVLAHAVFLNETDLRLVAGRRSVVAHCPLSNAYFANAVFPLRAALHQGVRVGLGTDVSGGPSYLMLDALKMTVTAARMLDRGVDAALSPDRRGRAGAAEDWRTAFYLATAGGGAALGLDVGRFEPGCAFDAQLIDPDAAGGTMRTFGDTSGSDANLARLLYTATPANVAEVWVAGRAVAGRAVAGGCSAEGAQR